MIDRSQIYLYNSFALGSEDLAAFDARLCMFASSPEFEIECRDSHKQRFTDFAELLKFYNTGSRTIRSLWMRAEDEARLHRVRIRFSDQKAPVYAEIEGNADSVAELKDFIVQRIESAAQEFRPEAGAPLVSSVALGLLAALGPLGAAVAVGVSTRQPGVFRRWELLPVVTIGFVAAGAFALSLAMGSQLNRGENALFPRALFAFGPELRRHRRLKALRWALIVALATALSVSVILNMLA